MKPLREDVVQTAEVRISDDDFGQRLKEQRLKDMRLWLDRRRFEPSAFTYFYLDPGMMVRVCFEVEGEADAFAEEFGGSLIQTQAAARAFWRHEPVAASARRPREEAAMMLSPV